MVRRVALIVALAGLLSVLLALEVRSLLVRGQAALLPYRLEGGRLVAGPGLASATSPGRARDFARAGLRDGDVIVEMWTAGGVGGRIQNLAQLFNVGRAGAREQLHFFVQRPSEGGRPLQIVVPASPGPTRAELAFALAYTVGVPVAALVAGLLLGLLRPDDTRAFAGSLMFLGFAGAFALEPADLPSRWRVVALIGQIVSMYGALVAFLWFFLIFPAPSLIERRVPWLKYAGLGAATAAAALTLLFYGAAFVSFDAHARLQATLTEDAARMATNVVALGLLGSGFLSLVLNTLRRQSRDERRRMVIVLGGTCLGLGSFLAVVTVYALRGVAPPLWVAVVLAPVLALFPLSFVYAIVRHRVLGTRFMVRRGVQYALVSGTLQVVLAAIAFALLWVTLTSMPVPAWQDPLAGGILAALAVFLLARLLRSVSQRLMPAIDRRFFRDAYDARRVLTELSQSVRELALEPKRLLTRVVDAVRAALHPRTIVIYAREQTPAGPAGPFRCVAFRRDEGLPIECDPLELPADGLLARRFERGDVREVRALDLFFDDPRSWAHPIKTDPAYAAERRVLTQLGAQIVVPLVTAGRLLGMLLLGEKRSEEAYSREDKDLLATVAEQTAMALDYGQLARRAAHEESLRKEVEIARSVQERLFPQSLPAVAGLDYAGVCRPASEIGGDAYDFISLGEGCLGLSVADISGKGVAAALLMANLQALLRSHAPVRQCNLQELVADINRLLAASIPDNRFATFFYGVIDTRSRRLTYVNAGHNPPMLLRNGATAAIDRLPPTGMMLGPFTNQPVEQRSVALEPGDLLIAYSDGISDALDPDGRDYGEARLEAVVRANAALPAAALQDRILADVADFSRGVPPFDDMTLVVARMT